MAIPSFSSTVVARAAAALYGVQLGNGTMSAVLDEANATGGVEKLINSVYARDYGSMDSDDVAAMIVSNLGITGAGVANAVAYLTAKIDAAPAGTEGAAIAAEVAGFSTLGGDATYGAAASAFNNRISAAVAYAQQGGTTDRAFGAGATISMTTGQDFLSGTSGNDVIVARIFSGTNTLQSGDWVDGGAGTGDRLEADLGGSTEEFSITPETKGVETLAIRAQSRASDSGDNNLEDEDRVIVDAQRLSGVTRFDSTESRADLIIEDLRTPLRTKDITIGMMGTDAGNVDYGVYFDRLRSETANTATLAIELMDTRAATSGDAATRALPLKDSPYNGFSFVVNGKTILLKDPVGADPTDPTTFNGAQTYEQLLAAVQKLLTSAANLAAYPELAGITAKLDGTFEARDTRSGDVATGQKLVLTGGSASAVTLGVGNFIADAGVPADSGLHTVQTPGQSSSTDLITSTVVLDDVGRGSNGGDLVIGAMSTGETSGSAGIGRFEIKVETSSALGIIASTNNALKEVVIANGDIKGNLRVQGFDNAVSLTPGAARPTATFGTDIDGNADGTNDVLPGASAQHNSYGFNDVRMINASAMTGTVAFDAAVTSRSFAKYIQLTDTDSNPGVDNDSTDGKTTRQVADFDYAGGSGNDTIAVVIDNNIAASNSNVQVGMADFTFVVNGNGGDDNISLVIGAVDRDADGGYGDDGIQQGTAGGTTLPALEDDDDEYLPATTAADVTVQQNWYFHQASNANVTINSGDGNDTVRKPGAGNARIDLGAGDDTVYTDNTGNLDTDNSLYTNAGRAVWVFNTDDQVDADAIERDIDDLESDSTGGTGSSVVDGVAGTHTYFLYRATLTVTYRGLESVDVPIGFNTSTFRTNDLYINQAIKAAINKDPILAKLLVAEDGPLASLVVRSLIDGEQTIDDLTVEINEVEGEDFSTSDISNAGLAAAQYTDSLDEDKLTEQEMVDLVNAEILEWEGDLGYVTAFANTGDAASDLTGADAELGSSVTDNTITGGLGNDVIVLSTTGDDSTGTIANSSNETIRYTGAFGDDTIINFTVDDENATRTEGEDSFSFTAVASDADIFAVLVDEVTDVEYEDMDADFVEAALAAEFDTGDIDDDGDLDEGEVLTFIYIAYGTTDDGLAQVWKVTAEEGGDADAEDFSAILLGTIDLADVSWADVGAGNIAGLTVV